MTQPQIIIAKAAGQAQGLDVGQVMGSYVTVQAQGQPAGPVQVLISRQGQGTVVVVLHALVMHGCHPQAV